MAPTSDQEDDERAGSGKFDHTTKCYTHFLSKIGSFIMCVICFAFFPQKKMSRSRILTGLTLTIAFLWQARFLYVSLTRKYLPKERCLYYVHWLFSVLFALSIKFFTWNTTDSLPIEFISTCILSQHYKDSWPLNKFENMRRNIDTKIEIILLYYTFCKNLAVHKIKSNINTVYMLFFKENLLNFPDFKTIFYW
jgi:hypothetical protein